MVQDRRRENHQLKVVGGDGTQYASEKTVIRTPIGTLKLPSWISRRPLIFILACSVLVGIIRAKPFDREEESNCLAMLLFCTILWATEVCSRASFDLLLPRLTGIVTGNPTLRHQFLRAILDRCSPYDSFKRWRGRSIECHRCYEVSAL
jgi:phosphate transporter